jgi:hypothetical protein
VAHRFSLPTFLAIAGIGIVLAACGDDPTQPDALFEFAEAEAVMRSAAALPSLPDLAATATRAADPTQRAALVRAQELWLASTVVDDGAGPAQRRAAIIHAAPVLTQLLPAEGWAPVRSRVEDWIGTAEAMVHRVAMPPVEVRLAEARHHLAGSDAATGAEDRVYHLLLAMSALVETTPRFVARRLVAEAALAVDLAEQRAAGASPRSLQRARRLADWAARAAEEEEHVRAIQRAYYAIQLAEES